MKQINQTLRPGVLTVLSIMLILLLQGERAVRGEESSARPDAFDAGETAAIEEIVRDYLNRHPEVIIDAINSYQESQRVAERERQQARIVENLDRLRDDPRSPVLGNSDGDVVVVEFFDYRCPYCKVIAPRLRTLIEEDPGIRLVMKEYPILSEASFDGARAALAAAKQGRYEAFHFALMKNPADLSDNHLRDVAESVGLDPDRLIADMEAEDIREAIRDNHELARLIGVTGTPALLVGETFVPGAVELEQLREIVAAARRESG